MSSVSTFKERKKDGLLPLKQAKADPRVTVCVDIIGPFTILNNNNTHTLRALPMIDPGTGWFEFVQATNKSATIIQDLFHSTWLACYPQLQYTALAF
jgi:hypothetical protein